MNGNNNNNNNHNNHSKMHMIALNIHIPNDKTIHSMQFNIQMLVDDVFQNIHQRLPIHIDHDPSDYGLFINDVQHLSRGYWLDPTKTLSYYLLKNGDHIEYKYKNRPLKIRLLDGTVKMILIDDSLIVAQLMVYICTKFGIANYDEYSLVYDIDADEGMNSTKTATLLRDRSLQRTDKKMEELKRKCHTDDDTLWLDHSKTLRQQDIGEQSTVILRRKYFFSDTNIDQRDPVQLNLLYVQCRNGIIDGTHPVTSDEATQFAGLQCQIQFGDYDESTHKLGVIDIRDILPKEYVKTKNIEKRISSEHKKHANLSELDGKLKYTQLCRSLRTYGVTFFLVKEKMSGKNKLVPRLLGVTKDSIVRVDERTKDFLETWPLTHIKRWTASPNTFTLDFGDYATAYYSVQTNEGQKISQLIAGYIDIILKKRKDREITMPDGICDEESTMIEDIIAPGKATIIQPNCAPLGYVRQQNVYSPPLIRGTYSEGRNNQQQDDYSHSQTHEQTKFPSDINNHDNYDEIVFTTIENARNIINASRTQIMRDLSMDHTQQIQPLSSMMDNQLQWSHENRLAVTRQLLVSELSTINASIAQIIILTSDINSPHRRHVDYSNLISTAISTVSNNLNEFCKEMNVYKNLVNDKTYLVDHTHRLCATFDDLLTSIQSLNEKVNDSTARQNVLVSASHLGEINQDLVRRLTNEFDCSIEYQDKLLTLAKSIANTTALYVLKAKDIATNVVNEHAINEIISTATQCALATSQLVACTKVVTATIASPLCQEQLIESVRNVTRSIEAVLQSCLPPIINETLYTELTDAGRIVRKTVNEFLLHIKIITDSTSSTNSDRIVLPAITGTPKLTKRRILTNDNIEENDEEIQDESIDQILVASDRLFASIGDAPEMVKQAKVLAQATAQLVSSLRQQAEAVDDDTNQQKQFLSAAKMLADATAKMVEAAKGCATKPTDTQLQYQLKKSVEELRLATNMSTSNHLKRKVIKRVEQCAKYCASCATQCIAATSASSVANKTSQSQQELIQQCKIVADLIPKIVQGIRTCMIKPDSCTFQINLLNVCDDFLAPATQLANLAQIFVSTISNQSQTLHLENSAKQLIQALTDLRLCLKRAKELWNTNSFDIESIIESIELLDKELSDTKRQMNDGHSRIKNDETIDSHTVQFVSNCKQMNTIITHLNNSLNQNDMKLIDNDLREILVILRRLIISTRHLATTTNDSYVQESIIERTRHVLQCSISFINELKHTIQTTNDKTKLNQVEHELLSALNVCMLSIPSQHYFNEVLKQMSEYVYTLAGPFEQKHSQSTLNSDEISRAATNLSQATTDLVVSTRTGATQDLARTSARFSRAFGDFIDNGIDFVSHQQEDEKRSHLIITLKNVHSSSNQLLEQAKSLSIEPTFDDNERKIQLANAARAVTETINDVIAACLVPKSTAVIERMECDNAIRDMETSKSFLQQPILQPCANFNYFESLDHVVENSKRLGEAMTHIASASKNTNHQLFVQAVQDASRAVCHLVEASAQACYIIGISEDTLAKGTSGILDQLLFNRSVTTIRNACSDLSKPSINQNEILNLAAIIAKNTSILCNIARDASINTNNTIARRHFVQSAKDVANATAELVRTIKILDSSCTQENHRQCIDATHPLLQAIDQLHLYATSKEFGSGPETISSAGRQLQEPILSAARNVVDGACRIIECSKLLIANSKEATLWQQLAAQTKNVSEAIKRLATSVKDMTPGQQECDRTIDQLRKCFQEVDKMLTNIDLLRKTDKNLQFHQEQIKSNSNHILGLINNIRHSSKCETERIGYYVKQFLVYFETFFYHTLNYTSLLNTKQDKITLLDQLKTLVETNLQLILSTKESAGNIKNIQWHKMVDSNSDLLIKVFQTFLNHSLMITKNRNLSDNIRQMISILDTPIILNNINSNDIFNRTNEVLRHMIDIIKQFNKIEHISNFINQLVNQYHQLIDLIHIFINTINKNELIIRIKVIIQDFGYILIEYIEKFENNHSKRTDSENYHQKFIEKISIIINILQSTTHGTQACISASYTVDGIINDLDKTILYATDGSLNCEHVDETFSDHREAILKIAKTLVEDTKTLVAGAASSQEQLAMAAQGAVRTITKLSDAVKLGAGSLGAKNGQAQIMLVNSVKDVALALNNLINVTKYASGKAIDDPEMQRLKESAKTMVINVTSLLRTVKTVEDETQRGTNALESAIQSIKQELQLCNNEQVLSTMQVAPDDFIRVIKQITVATSRAVAAGQSCQQDDIILAANLARKSANELLITCKSIGNMIDDKILRQRTLDYSRTCIQTYKDLLETIYVLIQKPSNEIKQNLLQHSRTIAQLAQELMHCAEQIKENHFVDSNDPKSIAENELFNAAQSIESAAKKLSTLKPRRQIKEIHENLNLDEQILDAAKSIMNAVSTLLSAATSAQKELVAQGKLLSKSSPNEDGQWSQGLISAAHYVASACHVLCDAANEFVQGVGTEEKLISSAKQVSSNTAALIVACKVKTDFMSQAMARLQNAGNLVKRAADDLVRTAQQVVDIQEKDKEVEVSTRLVSGIAQEIKCKEDILAKERELDEARNRLKAMRLARYGHSEQESNDST